MFALDSTGGLLGLSAKFSVQPLGCRARKHKLKLEL